MSPNIVGGGSYADASAVSASKEASASSKKRKFLEVTFTCGVCGEETSATMNNTVVLRAGHKVLFALASGSCSNLGGERRACNACKVAMGNKGGGNLCKKLSDLVVVEPSPEGEDGADAPAALAIALPTAGPTNAARPQLAAPQPQRPTLPNHSTPPPPTQRTVTPPTNSFPR